MPTVNNLKQLLDRKQWELCTPDPTSTTTGHFLVQTPPRWAVPSFLMCQGTSTQYLYYPKQDAWIDVASGTLGAAIAGSCGAFHPYGPTGTASAGSSTTLTSVTTLNQDVVGYTIRITSGTGAGQERTITSNTIGANSVITTASWSVTPDNTSVYLLLTGRFWVLGATGAAVVWKYFDVATSSWTAKSTTSGPGATFGNDGACEATSGSNDYVAIATGTATSGAAGTITRSTANWATNQWANFQVRITSGTGAGQVRTVNSNTATALTINANWTVTVDNTSVYTIEGNDDWLYVTGNSVVTMFRYAINGLAGLSANAQTTADTWITVAPGVARAGGTGTGTSLNYISTSTDVRFNTENTIQNGRRLYAFRGSASTTIDYYDIPSNAWTSGITYGNTLLTFSTGSVYCDHQGSIYVQKDGTGRFFRFDVAGNTLYPSSTLLYSQGGAIVGKKLAIFSYVDGATEIQWLYHIRNTGTEMFRMMII